MAPPGSDWDVAGPAMARATTLGLLYPVQIRLHRLLDSTRRGPPGRLRADASDCHPKSNKDRRCRTVCKCDLELDRQAVHRATMSRRERRHLPPESLAALALSNSFRKIEVWIGH